jgi:hypothetical protein
LQRNARTIYDRADQLRGAIMASNSDDDISQIIVLIRKIEADALKRGQDETVARIILAARGEAHAMTTAHGASVNGADQSPKRRPGGQLGAQRATRGSVRKFVYQVLGAPDYRGANYDGVIARVHELGGTDIASASVKNFLRSSEKRKEMRRQNDLWFLSQPPWAREGENRALEQPSDSQPQ